LGIGPVQLRQAEYWSIYEQFDRQASAGAVAARNIVNVTDLQNKELLGGN
jgi:hypothetical protein